MKNDQPVKPVLQSLPKIHKDSRNPPYRPTVSSIGSLTEKVSLLFDHHLQPYVKKQTNKKTSFLLLKTQQIFWLQYNQ